MATEDIQTATKRRRLIIGLISSPLFVAISAGIAMEWYRNHFEKSAPPPVALPKVAVVGKMTHGTDKFRKGIFDELDHYTHGHIDFKITNQGVKSSDELYLQAEFSDDVSVDGLSGFWAFEYKTHDGTFKPIEQQQNWKPEDHIFVVRLHELNPGIEDSMQVIFYYETGKTPSPPTITCWDSTTTYSATWEKP